MDRNSIIGLVLITLVIIVWMLFTSVNQQPPELNKGNDTSNVAQIEDTTVPEKAGDSELEEGINQTDLQKNTLKDSLTSIHKFGETFAPFTKGKRKVITIENDLLTAKFTNKGGALIRWKLKNYNKWDGEPSQLIWNDKGELFLTFVTMENRSIDTRNLYFEVEDLDNNYKRVSGDNVLKIRFYIEPGPGQRLVKTIKIYGNKYYMDSEVTLENMDNIIPRRGINYNWEGGLHYQEHNSVDESTVAEAMARIDGVDEYLNAEDDPLEATYTGYLDFAAVKTKYFVAAIIPEPGKNSKGTVDLYGEKFRAPREGIVEKYDMSLRRAYEGGTQVNQFRVYIGPLEYDHLKPLGLEQTISFGWAFIGWIGEYFILPLLMFIHGFIPNYGVTIIIFSIIMKIILYPFSIQQMKSAQKMKLLAPEMEKLREKHKDDMQKQQKETMALYSQYGVNPMGGCLPLILQMPILYALFTMFRNSIELRHADFFWYINDLSVPDTIVHFGFSILGLNSLSGLALLMGVTMFFQQKMTITDPRQKGMVYMMPVMFTLMFSYFPSGLNLYYFMFNLLSIAHQYWMNNLSKNKLTLEDLKKAPKKEGWLQKKMREAQDIAESQGRSIPGKKDDLNFNPNKRKKKPGQRKK